MKIILNGQPVDITSDDMASLLESLGHAPDSVATALNGHFVAYGDRAGQRLVEGDRVDVVAPMAGG